MAIVTLLQSGAGSALYQVELEATDQGVALALPAGASNADGFRINVRPMDEQASSQDWWVDPPSRTRNFIKTMGDGGDVIERVQVIGRAAELGHAFTLHCTAVDGLTEHASYAGTIDGEAVTWDEESTDQGPQWNRWTCADPRAAGLIVRVANANGPDSAGPPPDTYSWITADDSDLVKFKYRSVAGGGSPYLTYGIWQVLIERLFSMSR